VNARTEEVGAVESVFFIFPEGQAFWRHERSNAPIVEWKHGKTLGEFLSAVSLLVPPLSQSPGTQRGHRGALRDQSEV
jgi:hypothetical protein